MFFFPVFPLCSSYFIVVAEMKYKIMEIKVSYSGIAKDANLLGRHAVSLGENLTASQRILISSSSGSSSPKKIVVVEL